MATSKTKTLMVTTLTVVCLACTICLILVGQMYDPAGAIDCTVNGFHWSDRCDSPASHPYPGQCTRRRCKVCFRGVCVPNRDMIKSRRDASGELLGRLAEPHEPRKAE